jgi:hypothetical protein
MIIWIRCGPGRKIMFSGGKRRKWDVPSGVCREFTKKESGNYERMKRLLALFHILFKTDEAL